MISSESEVRDAVRYTAALYNLNGDARLYDQQIDVFAPDAEMVIQGGRILKGVDEIIQGLKAGAQARGAHLPGNFQRHHLTTAVIDVLNEGTALARHAVFVVTELGFDHSGFYHDDFIRIGRRWMIQRRRATMEWARPDSRFVAWLGSPGAADGQATTLITACEHALLPSK